jgi:gas vesicle protein
MRKYDEDDYDYDGQPYVVIERRDSGIAPLLLGIAIGAGAALLFAPRSGADTRRMIGDRARAAGDAAQRKADELMDSVTGTIGEVRDRFTEQVEATKSTVRRQRDDLMDALDAGRSAASEARKELERKLAERKQTKNEGKVS